MDIVCGPHWDRRIISISMPYADKDYAVFVSGGADSAIILYLLYLNKINTLHPSKIVPHTIPYKENDGALEYSRYVVDNMSRELSLKIPDIVYIEEDKSIPGDRTINEPIHRLAVEDNDYVQVFTGINHFAPLDNLPGGPGRPWRHKDSEDPNNRNVIMTPFLHLYKYHIIDLYYRFGIEDVLTKTYSCASSKTSDICGECYWCREREWAFEQLDKKDPALEKTF